MSRSGRPVAPVGDPGRCPGLWWRAGPDLRRLSRADARSAPKPHRGSRGPSWSRRRAVVSKLDNGPAPDRSPYLLSTILFPTEELPRHGTDK